ncbi:MAG: FAD-binding oxidoreductase [Burkholderiaceae bacterium]
MPPTATLTLVARRDYPGVTGQRASILRFAWPAQALGTRHGLARFAAGDLVGIVPPGSAVPRYYSLASGWKDGFLEICVRQLPGGLYSTHLLGLKMGDTITAFIRPNPGFALPRTRRPVLLIGAGTGVAPLAGFIRRNDRRSPMHLYFGGATRRGTFTSAPTFSAGSAKGAWQRWRRSSPACPVAVAMCRMPCAEETPSACAAGGQGALVRVCGSRAMAQGVAETLDTVLAPLQLSVSTLKAKERYAEDVF